MGGAMRADSILAQHLCSGLASTTPSCVHKRKEGRRSSVKRRGLGTPSCILLAKISSDTSLLCRGGYTKGTNWWEVDESLWVRSLPFASDVSLLKLSSSKGSKSICLHLSTKIYLKVNRHHLDSGIISDFISWIFCQLQLRICRSWVCTNKW